MSLYILTIKRPETCDLDPGTEQRWYFEDHPHFLRAKLLAERHGIYVSDNADNPEIVTDLDEFKNWLNEALPPQEDALQTLMRELAAAQDEYIQASNASAAAQEAVRVANARYTKANQHAITLLKHQNKDAVMFEGRLFTIQGSWIRESKLA